MGRDLIKNAYHEVAIPRDSPGYKRLLEEARIRGYTEVGKILNMILPRLLAEVPDLWHPAAPAVRPPATQTGEGSSDQEQHQAEGELHDNPAARSIAKRLGLLEDE
jgi:hypothetical protein